MKSLTKNTNKFYKLTKKSFAGGHKDIDYSLKEFDIAFIGGLNAANCLKYMQHTDFHGTMAAWNSKSKFYNEHHYEYVISGEMASYKYISMAFGSNFDNKQSAYFAHRIVNIKPEENKIIDDKGEVYTYKALVLNTGLHQKVENMPFVEKHVNDGEMGHSRVFIHNPTNDEHIERNRRIYWLHRDHDFLVYLPKLPSRREVYDHWYLSLDSYLSKYIHSEGLPANTKIRVITPNNTLFKFPFANEVVMDEISQRTMIELHFGWELTNIEVIEKGINSTLRYATFKNSKGEEMRHQFGTLLLSPNNVKRDIYKNNDLADEHGQVTVNPYTLQHVKYPNIFSFGDCINVDTTKSFYASINQQVVARTNLSNYLHGKDLDGIYEGYSSFSVYHSIDRMWQFSHRYGYEPAALNFYVPRFLGIFSYKLKGSLEKQFFSKIYTFKPNYGYPYLNKNRYFRPLNENTYLQKKGLTRKDIMIHETHAPELSFHHHH